MIWEKDSQFGKKNEDWEKEDLHAALRIINDIFPKKSMNRKLINTFDKQFKKSYGRSKKEGEKGQNMQYHPLENILREAWDDSDSAHEKFENENLEESARYWGKTLGLTIGFIRYIYAHQYLDEELAKQFGPELADVCDHITLNLRKCNRKISLRKFGNHLYEIYRTAHVYNDAQEDFLKESAWQFR